MESVQIGNYTVFSNGQVLGPRGKFLRPQKCGSANYLRVHLGRGGQVRLHRLVALHFVANPHGHSEVNHKDGNKANNSAENLEWVSRAENIRHAFDTGLNNVRCGESAPNAKLSDVQISQIRATYRKRIRGFTLTDLAAQFGCTAAHIHRIVNMQTRTA